MAVNSATAGKLRQFVAPMSKEDVMDICILLLKAKDVAAGQFNVHCEAVGWK